MNDSLANIPDFDELLTDLDHFNDTFENMPNLDDYVRQSN